MASDTEIAWAAGFFDGEGSEPKKEQAYKAWELLEKLKGAKSPRLEPLP